MTPEMNRSQETGTEITDPMTKGAQDEWYVNGVISYERSQVLDWYAGISNNMVDSQTVEVWINGKKDDYEIIPGDSKGFIVRAGEDGLARIEIKLKANLGFAEGTITV